MTNHTPGPFFSHGPFGYDGDITNKQGFVIAEMAGDGTEQDARLFAASPDLLAALLQALAEWDASDGSTVTCLTMDTVRAAIAKATKES